MHLAAKASAFKGCGGMVTPRMGSGGVGVYLDYHGFYVLDHSLIAGADANTKT